jgi:hypothetical protein
MFSEEVATFLEATGLSKRMRVQASWRNKAAERWIGSARPDCFDYLITLNEAHSAGSLIHRQIRV